MIIKIQNGDKDAMSEFYVLHFDEVLRKIQCEIKNKDDSEDIAQDCFITFFTRINTLKDPVSFEKWFNTVIRNKIRDYLLQDIRTC